MQTTTATAAGPLGADQFIHSIMPEPTVGRVSPWGEIQDCRRRATGIYTVSTIGHGGTWISHGRRLILPPLLADAPTFKPEHGALGWYEEDVDAILPVLAFPDCWHKSEVWTAVKMALSYRRASGTDYPLIAACRAFLATGLARRTLALADEWDREQSAATATK